MKVIDYLIDKVEEAGSYNPQDQDKPVCILWPDPDREWEHAVNRLRIIRKNILIYGTYNEGENVGPAIWIRHALAHKEMFLKHSDRMPIVYLPGMKLAQLNPSTKYDRGHELLIELQYRSNVWMNRRIEWRTEDFLREGLGINLKNDDLTREALKRSFLYMLDLEIPLLRDKLIDDKFLDELLCGDLITELLLWIDDPVKLRGDLSDANWTAFSNRVKTDYLIDTMSDTDITAAELLAEHEGKWIEIWEAYSESPDRFPNIINKLRRLQLPSFSSNPSRFEIEGWPKWNDDMEDRLREEMSKLACRTPEAAKSEIERLYREHSVRLGLPWNNVASFGCLKALWAIKRALDCMSGYNMNSNLKVLAEAYCNIGYKVDSNMLEAMKFATLKDQEAITCAIRSVYLPWLAKVSEEYQNKIIEEGIDAGNTLRFDGKPDSCVLFVDGLRFDIAKKVSEKLKDAGLIVEERGYTAPLPTLTYTCKPRISPVSSSYAGDADSIDFEPQAFLEGAKTSKRFAELMELNGWCYGRHSNGIPKKKSSPLWFEYDYIDIEGHNNGSKLSDRVDSFVDEIYATVRGLISSGWATVQIITDHGWLMMIGGLEKVVLHKSLTENRYGRCATIKGEINKTEMLIMPWYWNKNVDVALARGAGCFIANVEYAHGGLSLQECQLLQLSVKEKGSLSFFNVGIESIEWKGMRVQIRLNRGSGSNKFADIRIKPGDVGSSISRDKKPMAVDEFDSVKLIVENDDYIGSKAFIVVLDTDGVSVVCQKETIVGDVL